MRPSDRAAVCLALGCKVTHEGNVTFSGVTYPVWKVEARSNEHLVQVFNQLAALSAREDPTIRGIAASYVGMANAARLTGPAREAFLGRKIHRFVKETTKFQREEQETSRPTELTFALGSGDCDEQASLVAALAWAGGLDACVAPMRDDSGEISHVCAVINVGGDPTWVETTVDAEFGENPRAAVTRLGLAERKDVVG